MTDTQTIQHTNNAEKAKEMIDRKYKADYDIVLYWHHQIIKEELINNYLKDIKNGR